jgi:hypothetical protein
MNQSEELASDPLSKIQLCVARRADELARESKFATPLNLHCWLAAESEIMAAPGENPRVG